MGTAIIGFLVAACSSLTTAPVGEPGEVVTVVGAVKSVDASAMAVDGPAKIHLRTEDHGRLVVLVPACEGPCARQAVERLGRMRPGDRWTVTGEVNADAELVVYDDALHSLTPTE